MFQYEVLNFFILPKEFSNGQQKLSDGVRSVFLPAVLK